jgi:hypothetical protein
MVTYSYNLMANTKVMDCLSADMLEKYIQENKNPRNVASVITRFWGTCLLL